MITVLYNVCCSQHCIITFANGKFGCSMIISYSLLLMNCSISTISFVYKYALSCINFMISWLSKHVLAFTIPIVLHCGYEKVHYVMNS